MEQITNCKVKYFLCGGKWEHTIDMHRRVYDTNYLAPTLKVVGGGNTEVKIDVDNIRIRKLTPRECYRLMGFYDDDFDRAQKVNSDSQLYKQAGNSICVNVLEEIFKEML